VVAVEQAVAGPFCSRQLADLGADVIKIERPDGGDFARGYDGALNGLSAYFAWLNRGKRSVALDLRTEEGRRALGTLLGTADVFVHNLAPGVVERWGFGYEALRARLPRLIWCGISGYGPDGPYRNHKAYDLLVQAEAGLISLTGTPEAPAKAGVSVADIAAGGYAYSSVLAALLGRARSGQGERIDISMLECLVEWATPALYLYQGTGVVAARAGMRHAMVVPYGAYACRDGRVLLAVQNEREWERFCREVLRRPELAEAAAYRGNGARVAQREGLEAAIEACFAELDRDEVERRLEQAGIAQGALNDVAAVVGHPQLAARGRWSSADTPQGPIPALLPPHNLASVLARAPSRLGRVPELGEHTEEVLSELLGLE